MNDLHGSDIKCQARVAWPIRNSVQLLVLLLATFCLGTACQTRSATVARPPEKVSEPTPKVGEIHVDVAFYVEGTVTTKDGEPLSGVEVTLELGEPVYKAITPVKETHTITDGTGQFGFFYLSGVQTPSFSLTCRKPGYKDVVLKRQELRYEPYLIKLEPDE